MIIKMLTVLVGLGMLATVGVLLAGILGMGNAGTDGGRSNRLMRWRVGLQGLTLALFAVLLLLMRH